jgi:hypothetical protein
MTKEKYLRIKGYDHSYTGYLIKYFYERISNFEKLNFTVDASRVVQKIYNNENEIYIEITPHTLLPKFVWDENDIYDVAAKNKHSKKKYTNIIGKNIVDILEYYFSEILK